MEDFIQELAKRIKEMDRKIIIGISGHGAAGKTTFANRLINLLDKSKINYVNTDPYIIDSKVRNHAKIEYTYQNENHRYKMTACHPSAHHLPSLERDIRMVREGVDFYTIDTPYMRSELISSERNIAVVEGMSVAFIDPALFDITIYFYTNEETELKRRSTRDLEERGRKISDLRKSHKERRIQYEVFMHPYSQNFDVIIKVVNEQNILEKVNFDI
ncbi:uridine kinase family protein [Planococcus halocryophilus]|uniref:uridine kinase family protein n=1 Tax=Planococcus halocryophilus TaxID=1215089 RepID=UPI001F0D8117|nr:P-loop NTPase fold protein [Planococcus halocryophilus]MCH4826921.1 phosphoribulokinase [Planococcus halocryophilus]